MTYFVDSKILKTFWEIIVTVSNELNFFVTTVIFYN